MVWLALIGGALTGMAYGFVSKRGAFCMNSGVASAATGNDYTKIKAFAVAIAGQMLFVATLLATNLVSPPMLPSFFPVGAIVGGLLFGASMAWAGGCAAGVWYKSGAPSVGAITAVSGMAIGATLFEVGPFLPVRVAIQAIGAKAVSTWQLHAALGLPLTAIMFAVATLGLLALWRTADGTAGLWHWKRTGSLIGAIGCLALLASLLGGRAFGMAVIPGTVDLTSAAIGAPKLSWDLVFVLGIPFGGFIGAGRRAKAASSPATWQTLAGRFAGGLGLGAGASLAAGCTVGHGLAGLTMLAPGSVVTIIAIVVGRASVARWQVAKRQK